MSIRPNLIKLSEYVYVDVNNIVGVQAATDDSYFDNENIYIKSQLGVILSSGEFVSFIYLEETIKRETYGKFPFKRFFQSNEEWNDFANDQIDASLGLFEDEIKRVVNLCTKNIEEKDA